MSEEVFEQFNSINQKIGSNEINEEDAVKQIENLDFDSLSIQEIEIVEDADWIPDELYVKIIRSWMKNQEKNINHIISYLTMTNSIGKDMMISFVESICKPKNSLALEVNDIIEKIATGGGNREYNNPVDLGLIKATTPVELPKIDLLKLSNLFSGDPSKKFQSTAKPKASFAVEFPPYMKIIPRSYKLRTPPQMKGPKSWVLQADSGHGVWVDIASETNSSALNTKGSEATFQISPETQIAYSSFQFINMDLTHENSYSIVLSAFDISGVVILKSNKKF